MKILRRLFFGITFIPTFLIIMLFICPIYWIIEGEFILPLKIYTNFIENL